MTAIARKSIPNATTPAAATLPARLCNRVSSAPSASDPNQRTAPSAQPETRQPASRKTGSANRITIAPAAAGNRVGGAARGCVQAGICVSSDVVILDHSRGDSDGNTDDGTEGESQPEPSERPADQRADDAARRREPDEHASGAGEGERGSLGLHRREHSRGL